MSWPSYLEFNPPILHPPETTEETFGFIFSGGIKRVDWKKTG